MAILKDGKFNTLYKLNYLLLLQRRLAEVDHNKRHKSVLPRLPRYSLFKKYNNLVRTFLWTKLVSRIIRTILNSAIQVEGLRLLDFIWFPI